MPFYEYENPALEVSCLVRLPVDDRPDSITLTQHPHVANLYVNEQFDARVRLPNYLETPHQITLNRRTVPSRMTVGVGAKPPTQGDSLLSSYKKLEDAGQFTDHPNYLSAAEVKAAAALPDT